MMAAILSMAVLLIWSYFFAPKKPVENTPNTAQNANVASSAPTPEASQAPAQINQSPANVEVPDNNPDKTITINTPLYQAKLDSTGALATSWVLKKSVTNYGEKPLYADGTTEQVKKELELISEKAREANQLPFRLVTDDPALNQILNNRNYQVSVNEENIELNGAETKQIDFTLTDPANNLEVVKSFIFRPDSYLTDLKVKVLKSGQPVPNVKLAIGASIGDQGIEHHNYYHIEPEAVVYTNDKAERHQGASITDKKEDAGRMAVSGSVQWAGVGDAYFAMAAVPSQTANGAEIQASKYEVDVEPFYDGIINTVLRSQTTKETRHLLSVLIPIAADGSTVEIYTGTKDYFTLSNYNETLSSAVGRPIDIEDFVNFSNWDWFRPIFKPIAIVILRALNFINQFVNNYGISIIIFTILFYSLLFPMRWYQSRSFKKAQANAPKMKELQEKMKELQRKGIPMDDPRMREVQMEQLKMTKDAIPIGGCLPLILQMPLLIALYTAVTISLNFRQASFLWLPDLSTVDPYYILPFLFSGSMFVSMLITPTTAAVTPEQQMQQNMMKYLMPIMMLWIGWSVPSGLLVYWIMGNIVSFVQQKFINSMNKPDAPSSGETGENAKVVTKKPKLSTT